jgi:hypothetical protein
MSNKNRFGYVSRGNQRTFVVDTKTTFNIDNGAASTADDGSVGNFPFDCIIVDARAIYTEATDTVLGDGTANFKTGITAGGATLVAATLLEISKAIGSYTRGTPLAVMVPANTPIFTRHTGIATTEAGQYFVRYTILPKP